MSAKTKLELLHGWTYDLDRWQPFVQTLKKHKIQADLLQSPGLTRQISRPWTIADYLAWLDQQFASKSKVDLLGHSFGGQLAIGYAYKFPKKVRSLILVSSAGLPDQRLKYRLKRTLGKSLGKVMPELKQLPWLYDLGLRLLNAQDYRRADPIMRQTMKNVLSFDVRPLLSQIEQPVTLIWGKRDQTTPVSMAHQFHQAFPHSKLRFINQATHVPIYTHPEDVAKLIQEHLNEL